MEGHASSRDFHVPGKLAASPTEAAAKSSSIETIRCRVLFIECSPEIPRCHRAIGPPLFSQLHQLLRIGQLASSESLGKPLAHTVITDRPDIETAQIKKKQHFDGPAADAPDLGEAF